MAQTQPRRVYSQNPDGSMTFDPATVTQGAVHSQPSGWGYDNTGDPYDMIENDRGFVYGRGEHLNEDFQTRAGNQQGWEDIWRQQQIEQYRDLMSNPGYTQEQRDAILQQGTMPRPLTQDQINNDWHLSQQEQDEIRGNPYAARDFVRPDYLTSVAQEGNKRTLENYGQMADGMRGALNTDALRMSKSLPGQVLGTLDGSDAAVRGAISQGIKADPNFAGTLMGDVAAGEEATRGTIDAGRLRQDAQFADRYRMTDKDIQNYRDRVARNVGAGNRAALDEIEQRMVQGGNVSPMAYAALRARMQQNTDVAAADAMTDAEHAARAMQAERELNIETNRQGAEQAYAGLASGAELALARQRQQARMGGEDLRQQGEKNYSDMLSRAEMDMGNRRVKTSMDLEGMRIGSEQGAQDRAIGVEEILGRQGIAVAQDNRDTDLNVATSNRDALIKTTQDADDRASNRAGNIADHRTTTNRTAQGTQFDQDAWVNNAMSNRNKTIADASRADQQEGRGWLGGQQSQASNNVNVANGQRAGVFATQSGGMQDSTRTMGSYDLGRRGQSFGTNFKSNLGSSLGQSTGQMITGGVRKKGGF